MVRIKFCGITDIYSANAAVKAGADAIGFVFSKSKREVTPEQAVNIIKELPPYLKTIGVFVDEDLDQLNKIVNFCKIDVVQLHGSESVEYCRGVEHPVVKSFKIRNANDLAGVNEYSDVVSGILLDTYVEGASGGTGETFPWEYVASIQDSSKLIIAGGLHVGNIEEAIATSRPYAVDVSSGIEHEGVKDIRKMCDFVNRVRNYSF